RGTISTMPPPPRKSTRAAVNAVPAISPLRRRAPDWWPLVPVTYSARLGCRPPRRPMPQPPRSTGYLSLGMVSAVCTLLRRQRRLVGPGQGRGTTRGDVRGARGGERNVQGQATVGVVGRHDVSAV